MKRCKKCNKEKDYSCFSINNALEDGYTIYCKDCVRVYTASWRSKKKKDSDFLKNESDRIRTYYKKIGGNRNQKTNPKHIAIYRKNFPEKDICQRLSKSVSCQKGFERHHWSYKIEHAKDVIFLTRIHHKGLHRFLIYDQEFYMYRRIDTMELLDSRELHEAYFELIRDKI